MLIILDAKRMRCVVGSDWLIGPLEISPKTKIQLQKQSRKIFSRYIHYCIIITGNIKKYFKPELSGLGIVYPLVEEKSVDLS